VSDCCSNPRGLVPLDPGILEILGKLTELIGLGEHLKKLIPSHLAPSRRHGRVHRLLDGLRKDLDSIRSAIRIVRAVVANAVAEPDVGELGFLIDSRQVGLYVNGMERVQEALTSLMKTIYSLEGETEGIDEEQTRFYRMSDPAADICLKVQMFIDAVRPGSSVRLTIERMLSLLDQVESYVDFLEAELQDRDDWRRGPTAGGAA